MTAPLITYLTVFKSRLGIANILLDLTGFAHQPNQTLTRKVERVLKETRELSLEDAGTRPVFDYLVDKRLVGANLRPSGRYRGYGLRHSNGTWSAHAKGRTTIEVIPVYVTDIWMADARVRSTIGVPTAENANEAVELGFQLRLLSPSRNTWTAAGQLVHGLRGVGLPAPDASNPLVPGVESVGLLRQVVDNDGVLMKELVRVLVSDSTTSRDAIAGRFEEIVDAGYKAAKGFQFPPEVIRDFGDFRDLIRKTSQKRSTASSGPGVLQHRVAPRMEWLTDLGYLTKDGLKKNGFEYRVSEDCGSLLADLDRLLGTADGSEEIALSQWAKNSLWGTLRSTISIHSRDDAFLLGYELMRRRIGPAPMREVAFAASLLMKDAESFASTSASLHEFARETPGVSLSGGRYSRVPENIYIDTTRFRQ